MTEERRVLEMKLKGRPPFPFPTLVSRTPKLIAGGPSLTGVCVISVLASKALGEKGGFRHHCRIACSKERVRRS